MNTNEFPSHEVVAHIREQFPVGTRVVLIRMDDVQAPPIGTKGTVRGVDDIGSIMVGWDSGGSLNVAYGIDLVVKEDRYDDVQDLEKSRQEMHETVNSMFDRLLVDLCNGNDHKRVSPLNGNLGVFKGKTPLAITLPNKQTIQVTTWRELARLILQDCASDPHRQELLMGLRDHVIGKRRTILGEKPQRMNVPLKICEGLYFEGKFDTESLLMVLTKRVLDEVDYDYSQIRIQYQ